MDKKLIKQALSEAEQEAQEKTVGEIKTVIKSLLKGIDDEEKKQKESVEKLKVLKRDLDDIKQGRLDKIEERQEKDPKQKEISIIYVERTREYVPLYPWQSPWFVQVVKPYHPQYSNNLTYFSGGSANFTTATALTNDVTVMSGLTTLTCTGTAFQNFSGGTYEVNDKIINL